MLRVTRQLRLQGHGPTMTSETLTPARPSAEIATIFIIHVSSVLSLLTDNSTSTLNAIHLCERC